MDNVNVNDDTALEVCLFNTFTACERLKLYES